MTERKTWQAFIDAARQNIKEVDVEKARYLIQHKDYQILDVREPSELQTTGTISGAYNVPRGVLEGAVESNPVLQEARYQPWLIICRSGARSALATEVLQQMGFTNVINVKGGILAWQEANYRLVLD